MVWKQMIGYVPVNLANILVSFGGILILTRLLDASEYGIYALVFATLQLSHTLFFTWMEAAMERFHARAEREGNLNNHIYTLYRTSVTLMLAGILIFMIAIMLSPFSLHIKTVLAFALGSTAVQSLLRLGMEAHKAANRIIRYSLTNSAQMTISFTLGILLVILTPLREAGPFAGLLLGNLIMLCIDLPFMRRFMKGGTFQPNSVKNYLLYGVPICFSLILEYALSTSDRFVIALLLTEADVGKYSAGYGLANRSIDVLFIWIGIAVTPMLVRTLESEGMSACLEQMKTYGATLLLVTMPAAVGLGLVAQPVSFLLGEPVREAGAQIIPWIVGAGVVNGMISYYIQRAFMLSGNTKMLPITMIVPMIINIGLNFILLPRFGLMGAVYATIISYAIGFVLALIVARRYFALPIPWVAFLKCSLSCAVMAALVLAVKTPETMNPFFEVIIKGAAGALIYVICCLVLNTANCRTMILELSAKLKAKRMQSDEKAIKA